MRAIFAVIIAGLVLTAATLSQLRPQARLDQALGTATKPLILDREGEPLRFSFADDWNFHQQVELSSIPPALISAILSAEDKRFFFHNGVDWLSRLNGLWLNLRRARVVRGSSTITEQVVRMLYPRPRNIWSKWLEGFEAFRLERRNSKNEILKFYVNQVPFARQRRGVVQAAQGFFNRDLSTLNEHEMFAIAAMIKRPARLDNSLEAGRPRLPVEAPHFIEFVESQTGGARIQTTLHPGLQNTAQKLIDEALRTNPQHELHNGAVILADHQTDEVLVWAVGRGRIEAAAAYNSPLIPRQPGSSLKPFLYAMAMERGFGPNTLVEDAPLSESVGTGLHTYRNYSRTFYGWLPMREALANSLNIPAVRVIKLIGVDPFLARLQELNMTSLSRGSAFYGDGLALGNGEVPLWQMIQGYAALARQGVYRPLQVVLGQPPGTGRRVFTASASHAVNDILSDHRARRLEFGRGGNMEFPLQTAVKTGTSTDFRDAWAFAYNYKFVAAVWLGNLDNAPTKGLTGSTAPMLIARALMNEALRGRQTERLTRGEPVNGFERFESVADGFRIVKPSSNMRMAIDPRVPATAQAFTFQVEGHVLDRPVKWIVDGAEIGRTTNGQLQWPLTKGRHELKAEQGAHSSERVFYVR